MNKIGKILIVGMMALNMCAITNVSAKVDTKVVSSEVMTPGQVDPDPTKKPTLDEIQVKVNQFDGSHDDPPALMADGSYEMIAGRGAEIEIYDTTGKSENYVTSGADVQDYYVFEATVSDVLNNSEYGLKESAYLFINPKTSCEGTIQIKVTDKEDASKTKTMTIKMRVLKGGKASIENTESAISTEEIINAMKGKGGELRDLNISFNPDLTTSISKEVFAMAKAEGVNLHFSSTKGIGNYVTFDFEVADITDTTIDFNPNFTIGAQNADVTALIPADASPLIVDFAHNGALPGKAKVTVGVDMKSELWTSYREASELYVYHVDYETGALVKTGNATIEGYGQVGFEITHCSQYALTTKELTAEQTKLPILPTLDNVPNTGV